MSDRRGCTADALLRDLTNQHHHLRAASEEEVERRMRKRYPQAVAVLVRPGRSHGCSYGRVRDRRCKVFRAEGESEAERDASEIPRTPFGRSSKTAHLMRVRGCFEVSPAEPTSPLVAQAPSR